MGLCLAGWKARGAPPIAEVGLYSTLGYLHVCQLIRQALVYDLMEPCRSQVGRESCADSLDRRRTRRGTS